MYVPVECRVCRFRLWTRCPSVCVHRKMRMRKIWNGRRLKSRRIFAQLLSNWTYCVKLYNCKHVHLLYFSLSTSLFASLTLTLSLNLSLSLNLYLFFSLCQSVSVSSFSCSSSNWISNIFFLPAYLCSASPAAVGSTSGCQTHQVAQCVSNLPASVSVPL